MRRNKVYAEFIRALAKEVKRNLRGKKRFCVCHALSKCPDEEGDETPSNSALTHDHLIVWERKKRGEEIYI